MEERQGAVLGMWEGDAVGLGVLDCGGRVEVTVWERERVRSGARGGAERRCPIEGNHAGWRRRGAKREEGRAEGMGTYGEGQQEGARVASPELQATPRGQALSEEREELLQLGLAGRLGFPVIPSAFDVVRWLSSGCPRQQE